jgi:hypothetical protein
MACFLRCNNSCSPVDFARVMGHGAPICSMAARSCFSIRSCGALRVVREAQGGTAEQRRQFARSPQRRLAEALSAEGADVAEIGTLFVETQQFSERVSGIDIWRKPVLPWIKPKPNSWLPEAFGLHRRSA